MALLIVTTPVNIFRSVDLPRAQGAWTQMDTDALRVLNIRQRPSEDCDDPTAEAHPLWTISLVKSSTSAIISLPVVSIMFRSRGSVILPPPVRRVTPRGRRFMLSPCILAPWGASSWYKSEASSCYTRSIYQKLIYQKQPEEWYLLAERYRPRVEHPMGRHVWPCLLQDGFWCISSTVPSAPASKVVIPALVWFTNMPPAVVGRQHWCHHFWTGERTSQHGWCFCQGRSHTASCSVQRSTPLPSRGGP